jgi:hypothetical protein
MRPSEAVPARETCVVETNIWIILLTRHYLRVHTTEHTHTDYSSTMELIRTCVVFVTIIIRAPEVSELSL